MAEIKCNPQSSKHKYFYKFNQICVLNEVTLHFQLKNYEQNILSRFLRHVSKNYKRAA
ncbi:hypothetical protein FPC831_50003 [Flavobacterium psychrophilum]|nr:hypothetical protein FPC831_50003 [Flavobacterium psychrophilum]SNB97761.1 hypothetical protein FPC840_770012 [Flavobacterium psychrophilum]